jgi:glycolate oxidase FAD binding subunit
MTPPPAAAPTPRVWSPRDRDELLELLRSRPGRLRLVGAGSRQRRAPAAGDAARVQLAGLATIVRLDGPDQTCTVDTGVRREHLDEALAPLGLELPCPGGGTLGGLFASDPIGAATHGGAAPRSLLLGVEGALADGTAFKAGARVVKSVAGFDVHKLLVGSAGRLFVATRLHLRLKPRPRAEQWFAQAPCSEPEALAQLARLRSDAVPPAALQLARDAAGRCRVRGRFAGRSSFVAAAMRRHGLVASAPCWRDHVELASGAECLAGIATAGSLPHLLATLGPTTPMLWHGGGRWEAAFATSAACDAALAALPALGVHAQLAIAPAARSGRATPVDAGHERVAERLRQALDPHGILV